MDCEMCGANAIGKAIVEGVTMHVCSKCMRHGKQIQEERQSTRVQTKKPQDDIVETVRGDVANLLRIHREKQGLTQDAFSQKLGIKSSTYHHYESGQVKPDIATARKLERELRVQLVQKIKYEKIDLHREESQGLTIGDLIKKSKP